MDESTSQAVAEAEGPDIDVLALTQCIWPSLVTSPCVIVNQDPAILTIRDRSAGSRMSRERVLPSRKEILERKCSLGSTRTQPAVKVSDRSWSRPLKSCSAAMSRWFVQGSPDQRQKITHAAWPTTACRCEVVHGHVVKIHAGHMRAQPLELPTCSNDFYSHHVEELLFWPSGYPSVCVWVVVAVEFEP